MALKGEIITSIGPRIIQKHIEEEFFNIIIKYFKVMIIAGGHLTCTVGIGIASGNYSDIFGNPLRIKGLVPFYPANGHAAKFGGSDVFTNPDDHLVNVSSPPCLVFQGLEDGLVHPSISQDLKDAYTAAGNPNCAILYFPFAGHAADSYFKG